MSEYERFSAERRREDPTDKRTNCGVRDGNFSGGRRPGSFTASPAPSG